jgi:hypothetical protein
MYRAWRRVPPISEKESGMVCTGAQPEESRTQRNEVNAGAAPRRIGILAAFALAMLLMILPTSMTTPTAAAEPEYVQQKRATYVPDDVDNGGKPNSDCIGEVFIGQTTTNSIHAYSTLECKHPYAITSTETWIAPGPDTLDRLAEKTEVCNKGDCTYVIATVNLPGGAPGSEYCVGGHGTFGWPGRASVGGTEACITI